MPVERKDILKLGENFATVIGVDVQVGQQAPEFTSSAQDWSSVNPITESKGKVAILCAVPSLETDVCDRETRRFNEEASKLSDDIIVWTISTDFPMAQKRWCGAAGIENVQVVSDVLNAEFGEQYGLLVKERRYLRRAVFIVDREGKLVYVAYMPKLGQEPDYAEVIAAAKNAL
jgi:thiol peroxidase